MSDQVNHSIAGSWLGKYGYQDDSDGSTFEAVFLESRGYIEGSILDDCSLGEAFVTGTFVYPNISFTKKYRKPGLEPVEYRGQMSADGQSLLGIWSIKSQREGFFDNRGTWTAFRDGTENAFPIKTLRKELLAQSGA
ncbi:MAG: hypothetical protein J0M35_01205 [Candidatus Obscuribacter phosphatis]|uniref:Uncharacterized protein n=1 Tax=Candidatus Obscuribacter phosphatis TaxID=1906157 RepID=A0A8J7PJD1_9BACT|nr:hypothetical protein [Candidatus Obscuribacter phosphatis]